MFQNVIQSYLLFNFTNNIVYLMFGLLIIYADNVIFTIPILTAQTHMIHWVIRFIYYSYTLSHIMFTLFPSFISLTKCMQQVPKTDYIRMGSFRIIIAHKSTHMDEFVFVQIFAHTAASMVIWLKFFYCVQCA